MAAVCVSYDLYFISDHFNYNNRSFFSQFRWVSFMYSLCLPFSVYFLLLIAVNVCFVCSSDFCLLLYASYVYAVCLSAVIRLFLANLSPYVYLQFHLSFTPFVVYSFLVYFRLLRYRLQLLD